MKPPRRPNSQRPGFTLIELLVVIAIISILASMMLPGLGRAKEQAKMATCLNNLRQLGITMRLYVDDHGFHYPPTSTREPGDVQDKWLMQTIGGGDPIPRLVQWYVTAKNRPFASYLSPSEVFRCPVDKGQAEQPCIAPHLKPSNWFTLGCSYQYNVGPLAVIKGGGFKVPPVDEMVGMGSKDEGWVPTPSKFIVMHEPTARLYGCADKPWWYQWHFARGATDIEDPTVARQDFISPIQFADGHVAVHNFSKSLSRDPYYPYEPTQDWIWYKPSR